MSQEALDDPKRLQPCSAVVSGASQALPLSVLQPSPVVLRMLPPMSPLKVGQRVVKQGEDSRFEGAVVAVFVKRDGKTMRYVVENDDGG